MKVDITIYLIFFLISTYTIYKATIRLRLSRAKHKSLRGHAKWSRRISKLIPYFEYSEKQFYCSDKAPTEIESKRRHGMQNLLNTYRSKYTETIAFSASIEESVSDVRFTSSYKAPFPYRSFLQQELKLGSIVDESDGVRIKDLDGNWNYDLSGSYGVNVFGYDFYKNCLKQGYSTVNKLGPVLGPYHPLIRDNVTRLKSISGLDEVSFHMSGTEAVMQAVRLARYNTGKTHLVRLCGAYHGWWDGVQPGIGNQRITNDVYTLADLSKNTLKVLDTRNDIACILINPLQALNPNADASSDATLINSTRSANFDRDEYTNWLQQIREICTRRNIVLIFDEVFTGFRLSHRGAQEYFKVQADMVTYGKTLGGGLPVGVVCGRKNLMKRYKDNQPANISFARGTFNTHPYVMGTMNEFLNSLDKPEIQDIYSSAESIWNTRVEELNKKLEERNLPLKIVNMHSILTILYTQPSRYNWMFQFYLKAEGLELSWIGSGRLIMSLNYTDDDFNEVSKCFIQAAKLMKKDEWWWSSPLLSNKSIKKMMLLDILKARFPVINKFTNTYTNKQTDLLTKKAHQE